MPAANRKKALPAPPAPVEESIPEPRKRGPRVDVEQTRKRRADIMRAAAGLIDRAGYHNVNLETIAQAAGLKKPTLYHYFRSKDEILYQIHATMLEGVHSKLRERRDAGLDPQAVLQGIFVDFFEQMTEYPGYVRTFFEHLRDLDSDRHAQIRKERNAYFADIITVITEGMEKRLFNRADPRLTALCLISIVNWGYQWYRPKYDGPPQQIARKLWAIFKNGLAVHA